MYRAERLINWCVSCRTALSDLEVDYDEGRHRTDEPAYHDEVGKYYDPWGGTPPMEGTERACPVA